MDLRRTHRVFYLFIILAAFLTFTWGTARIQAHHKIGTYRCEWKQNIHPSSSYDFIPVVNDRLHVFQGFSLVKSVTITQTGPSSPRTSQYSSVTNRQALLFGSPGTAILLLSCKWQI